MAKKSAQSKIEVIDLISFLMAVIYMQSVLTVAHHTSMRVHDGTVHIVDSPTVAALVIGLVLALYSCYKNRKISTILVIALTIFTTASIFWLSGLRTNFYF